MELAQILRRTLRKKVGFNFRQVCAEANRIRDFDGSIRSQLRVIEGRFFWATYTLQASTYGSTMDAGEMLSFASLQRVTATIGIALDRCLGAMPLKLVLGSVPRYPDLMNDVTRILSEIDKGDDSAAERLLPLVYDELRKLAAAKLAHEKPGQTLQATALVHEAYLRLLGKGGSATFDGRGHFFAAAAEAMRRLLVERARRHASLKRGGDWNRIEMSDANLVTVGTPDQIVALDEALDRLASEEPQATKLVKLVIFGGFPLEEAGRLLDLSRATAYRQWAYARAWLKNYIEDSDRSPKK